MQANYYIGRTNDCLRAPCVGLTPLDYMHNLCILCPWSSNSDPIKAHRNQRKHGVSFAHAELALQDDTAVTIEDADAIGEQRFITSGIDALSRLLVVVHTQRGDRTRLISARKASPGESEQYHA